MAALNSLSISSSLRPLSCSDTRPKISFFLRKSFCPSSSSPRASALSSVGGNSSGYRQVRQSSITFSAADGISGKLAEDSKFVPLNAEDPVYGPPVLLLSGFEADETQKIRNFLKELDGEFLKIVHCTEDMLSKSLWDAVHSEQSSLKDVKIAKRLPRMCILSGLTGEEMMMFIDSFPESGLEPAIFAALVPNSANKRLEDVMEEIMGDHEMLSGEQSD